MTDNKENTASVNSDNTPADDNMDKARMRTENNQDTNNNEFTDDYPCTDYDREKISDKHCRKKFATIIIVLVCIIAAAVLFRVIRSSGKNRR